MCGIAGIVGAEGQRTRDFVSAMNTAMAVRGPDDSGEWQHGPVCLGHRRLSIIDCSAAGHQPMLFENGHGTHAITFNGEIYNFPDLRQELPAAEVPLVSRNDTEFCFISCGSTGLKRLCSDCVSLRRWSTFTTSRTFWMLVEDGSLAGRLRNFRLMQEGNLAGHERAPYFR
jgi:glutamine phosphoribosylpyrophosphate amidotransferase